MRRRLPTAVAVLALGAPLAGCYTYSETALTSLSPGIQARVRLDEDGFGRLVNQAAVNDVPVATLDHNRRRVAGRVQSVGPTTMRIELRRPGGSVISAEVPLQAVEEAAVRTFSTRRTIGAVGLGGAIAALIYSGTTGGTTSPTPPPEPENLRVPFFSITIPR